MNQYLKNTIFNTDNLYCILLCKMVTIVIRKNGIKQVIGHHFGQVEEIPTSGYGDMSLDRLTE